MTPCATIHKLSKVSGYLWHICRKLSKTVDVCGPSSTISWKAAPHQAWTYACSSMPGSGPTDWTIEPHATQKHTVAWNQRASKFRILSIKSIQDYQPLKFCLISGLYWIVISNSTCLCFTICVLAFMSLSIPCRCRCSTNTVTHNAMRHNAHQWTNMHNANTQISPPAWLSLACSTTQATLVLAAATSRSAGDFNCAGKGWKQLTVNSR